MGLEMGEARHAWLTGGRPALEETLQRFQIVNRAREAVLTDANGTDLLTGERHPELVRGAHGSSRFPFYEHGGTVFTRADENFYYFLVIDSWKLFFANLQWTDLLVLALAVLLCYALAYHLTAPLRALRKVLDRFGRGEFQARADASRRDEMGELAGSFNQMANHIETLLAAERRLLLDISHELRSPLARLSVAVELARSGDSSSFPLDRIQKEADRLNALIGQMLEVTRVEGDPAHRRSEPVDLNELVDELVDSCSIEARARGCSLSLNELAPVVVEGDSELLRRAIENVIRNAIRYAPPGSQVEVSLQDNLGRARIRVRDYGPGVPDEALPHLFEPFYRVDSDRNRGSGGAGLGLSIARRAVELHQGTLQASNADPGLLVEIVVRSLTIPMPSIELREHETLAHAADSKAESDRLRD
jgi:signal transduction histidine kinase